MRTPDARPCPACGADAARLRLTTSATTPDGMPYRLVACRTCGLAYTDPLPTPAELAGLYSEIYYVANERRLLSRDFLRTLFGRSVFWRHRQALLGRPPGRILDVGCGNGEFLVDLRRRGWEVCGTDFSAAACALARARGITVHHGELAGAGFPDRHFDVITLWHVFEHLPDPPAELAEIRRLLRDDGLLVIEVPNIASPTFRLCGEHWYPFDVPRHLQHFTPATLARLLRRGGFAPVRRQAWHHWDFTYSFYSVMNRLSLMKRLGITYFSTDYKRARPVSRALFLAAGLPVALLSLPYSLLTGLGGTGETFTVTARKTPCPRDGRA